MKKIIVIAGPTASGKTSVSVKVAKELNGEIISADSMQIYKELDIGTAKVTEKEMDGVPHHMISIVDKAENYSVAEYAKTAKELIDDIIARGKTPIICGGTGLYINAILFERSFGKTIGDDSVREKYENIAKEKGRTYLHDLLMEVDSESAEKLHENDVMRVVRALEIFEVTGKKKSAQNDSPIPIYDTTFFCLELDREILYSRIEDRVEDMLYMGLEKEAIDIITAIPEDSQSLTAIGYKEFIPYMYGEDSLKECIANIKQNSRHYAKRQLTWFRHQATCEMVDASVGAKKVAAHIVKVFNS